MFHCQKCSHVTTTIPYLESVNKGNHINFNNPLDINSTGLASVPTNWSLKELSFDISFFTFANISKNKVIRFDDIILAINNDKFSETYFM